MSTPFPPPQTPPGVDPVIRRHQRRNNRLELWLAMTVGIAAAIVMYAL